MKPALIPTVAAAALTLGQIVSAQTPTSSCADQPVFDQCKANQDTYLKTCSQQDYACLCRWQTVKVSCWNSCPNDPERSTQESLAIVYCSQPGANV
ncbi:hypothetical protein BX666DRAFT_1978078 [Dichotomocladium elegans]|nr:hypothetical protein BX666DRAFT_1978078 [Dichotomocladium elegans]